MSNSMKKISVKLFAICCILTVLTLCVQMFVECGTSHNYSNHSHQFELSSFNTPLFISSSQTDDNEPSKDDLIKIKLEELKNLSYEEKVMMALDLSWKGMLIIFVAIGLIYGVIKLCNIQRKPKQ